MRINEAVRVFEQTKAKARAVSTWRLKLWAYWARRRVEYERTEPNLIRQIAVQDELNHRFDRSKRAATILAPVPQRHRRRMAHR
jgi:hypothetical protein